ncbi:MAG: hypothetical protein U5N86_08045 [Planctomycetota bacterium]|nr:hypothetical protein [Planctomycetota bacterium]
MRPLFAFILLLCLFSAVVAAPDASGEEAGDWKKLQENAEAAYREGDSGRAFALFEQAFRSCTVDRERKYIINRMTRLRPSAYRVPVQKELDTSYEVEISEKTAFLQRFIRRYTVPQKVQLINKLVEMNPRMDKWAEDTIRTMSASFLEKLSKEEREELNRLIENKSPVSLDDYARKYIAEGNYRMAIKLYWAYVLRYEKLNEDRKAKIMEKIDELMDKLITEVTPEQQAQVDECLANEYLQEWDMLASEKFILIGPKSSVAKFKTSHLVELDTAYILTTDFFGIQPVLDSRLRKLLVLRSFSASQSLYLRGTEGYVVYSGLFPVKGEFDISAFYTYWSRAHNTMVGYPGIRSGYGELCRIMCDYMFERNTKIVDEMREYAQVAIENYVQRGLDMHEMPPYECAAGFYCFFLLKYGLEGFSNVQWLKARSVLDIMRTHAWAARPMHRGTKLLYFALASVFGKEIYDDLKRWGIDASNETHTDMAIELGPMRDAFLEARQLYNQKKYDECAEKLWQLVRDYPAVTEADNAYRLLMFASRLARQGKVSAKLKQRLGIIDSWRTCGPFYSSFAYDETRLAQVFPPDTVVDFGKVYPNDKQKAKWKARSTGLDGTANDKYSYPNAAVGYALTYVECEEEADAELFFSCSQPFRINLNNKLVAVYPHNSTYYYSDHRFSIRLRKGVNKLMLKFTTALGSTVRFGGRIVSPGGLPIPGMKFSSGNLESKWQKPTRPARGEKLFSVDGEARNWLSPWTTSLGNFVNRGGALYPQSKIPTDKWFRFDKYSLYRYPAPANISWLTTRFLPENRELSARVKMTQNSSGNGQYLLTLLGEGRDDVLKRDINRHSAVSIQRLACAYGSALRPGTLCSSAFRKRITGKDFGPDTCKRPAVAFGKRQDLVRRCRDGQEYRRTTVGITAFRPGISFSDAQIFSIKK